MVGRVEEEEEEEEEGGGIDLTTMSLFSSQPSSTSFGLGLGDEDDEFKFICFPPSSPSPPLSPLWKLFDDHPIPTKVNSVPQLPSPPPLSPLWNFSDHHPEIQNSFGGLHNTIPTEVRSISYFTHKSNFEGPLPSFVYGGKGRKWEEMKMISSHGVLLSFFVGWKGKKMGEMEASFPSISFPLLHEQNSGADPESYPSFPEAEVLWARIEKVIEKVREGIFQSEKVQSIPEKICRDLLKHVGLFQNTKQGQVSPQSTTVTLSCTLLIGAPKQDVESAIIEAADYLSPNKAPLSLVEVPSSIVESTHGACEAKCLAVNAINQKKRTISSSESAVTGSSVSLEVLQQHFSMTREKAAESLRVSVPTLKRSCRKHGISRWPYLKKTKKTPSLFDLNCVNVNLRDSIAGEFDKKIVTTNPSLCHVQPMVPLRSLSGTLSLETLNQDVGSVTVHATGNIPLNDPSMILVDVASSTARPTQKSNAIAKLYCEEQKSIVGCDVINGGDGIGDAEALTSMNIAENHKKRTISSSKRAGTGTSMSLEDLQQHCYMTRNEAAKKLGVSVSTLKRACREHKISSWLHLKRREKSESPSEMKSMSVTKQDIVTAGSSQTDLRAVNSVQEVKFVTVKATYKDKMIRFDLPSLSKMVKLEEEVAKRLKLEVGSFSIEYVDEANDQILLACSDDLQYCIDTWKSLGKAEIRMVVKLITTS